MSKYLIELGLEDSIEDWLNEMRWKRNYRAFQSTLSECETLLREEIASARAIERARCTGFVEKVSIADIDSIADLIPSECEVASESRLIELVWQAAAIECLKRIRGDKC